MAGRVEGPVSAEQLASPEQLEAFNAAFLDLLERRTGLYTMGESTSVPTHVAADILQSIAFVLGIDPGRPEVPPELLSVDLDAEYRRRLDEIACRVERAQALWRDVCATMPMIDNIALRDTLENIGAFFKWYDYRNMAHDIPCSIDYPLCHPVPESLQGVDYIAEYLRRLMIEATFLERFERPAIERVLSRSCRDYVGLLINVYEPVAATAVGLALVAEDPSALAVSDEARDEIGRRLGPLSAGERARELRAAAAGVCEALGISDPEAAEYLAELVPELLPRVGVGLAHGDLRGVFAG